jgi:hypothetical protein
VLPFSHISFRRNLPQITNRDFTYFGNSLLVYRTGSSYFRANPVGKGFEILVVVRKRRPQDHLSSSLGHRILGQRRNDDDLSVDCQC